MGNQLIAGQFRAQGINNLVDSPTAGSGWTAGATIIEPIASQAPLGEIWSIVGWSITLGGLVQPGVGWTQAMFGRPGRIIGGLVTLQPTPLLLSGVPWASPFIPFPNNTSGLTTIWDSSTDPMLPANGTPGGPLPLIGQMQLPVPIEMYPGEQMQIGIWLMPSLAQNTQIAVENASYVVTFDDHRPIQAGWGA